VLISVICAAVLTGAGGQAAAQVADSPCGNPFANNVGPHDYRVEQGFNRKIVEDYHFTPRVEALIGGISAPLGGDIDYTLRAFPNHHRALVSMMNLGARLKSDKPVGAQFTVECYFRRALTFRPDDHVARMIYAKFLLGAARKAEAGRQLDYVAENAQDNGFTQYNAGLLYLEMGEFDKALTCAHKALRLGFGGTALRKGLETAGKWSDPPDVEASSAASAPVAASATSAASR
jgi:hypothetical protein